MKTDNMQALMAEFAKLPEEARRYWLSEASRVRWLRILLRWLHETIPALKEYAAGYPQDRAFVLGTGPSVAKVKREEWDALTKYFTVGANAFPLWLQENRNRVDLPALNLVVDLHSERNIKGKKKLDAMNEAVRAMDGKAMVDDRSDNMNHDWVTVVFGKNPDWNLEEGLAIVPQVTPVKWSRTVVACVHLCGLLGFEEIFLLGADHGADYHPNEPEQADRGWTAMSVFLLQRQIKLLNCGACSSVRVLPSRTLAKALE